MSDEVRKSGAITAPTDALELTRWVSRVVSEALGERFGRGVHVEVEISVRDVATGASEADDPYAGAPSCEEHDRYRPGCFDCEVRDLEVMDR